MPQSEQAEDNKKEYEKREHVLIISISWSSIKLELWFHLLI